MRLEDTLCTIIFKPSQANFGTSFREKWVHLSGLAFLRRLVKIFFGRIRFGVPPCQPGRHQLVKGSGKGSGIMKVTALAPSMGAEITNIDLAACCDRATGSIDSTVIAEIRYVQKKFF